MKKKPEGMAWKEWRTCKSKKTHRARWIAKTFARLTNRKFKQKKKVYRCPYCNLFHVGSPNPRYEEDNEIFEAAG